MDSVNWPLTTGCENIGGGCKSCPSLWEYREKGLDYNPIFHTKRIGDPYHNQYPTLYTVSLGSDLFHSNIPDEFITAVFRVMNYTPRHTFEIATKRIERLKDMASGLKFTQNIAVGVTVEESKYKWRIDFLQEIPAATRYVSFLPLLGPVGKLDLHGIRTVTIGPEDWGLHRPCKSEWIDDIKKQCSEQNVDWITDYHIYNYDKEV